MIKRTVQKQVKERLTAHPGVALAGPRQCRKTTLAQAMRGVYFDLEQESDRLRLDLEWDDLVAGNERCLSCDLPTFLEHLRAAWT